MEEEERGRGQGRGYSVKYWCGFKFDTFMNFAKKRQIKNFIINRAWMDAHVIEGMAHQ